MRDPFSDYALRSSAKKMVSYAHKKYVSGNGLAYYVILHGIGAGRLSLFGEEHNYRIIIDEIHNYQARHPLKNVKDGYKYALDVSIRVIGGKHSLTSFLNCFSYELQKQEEGTGTFKLDYNDLLNKLKKKIDEKIDIIREQDKNCDFWIQEELENLTKRVYSIR